MRPDPWRGEHDEPADSWWAQRDADEKTRAVWRANVRAEAGLSVYTIHPDPDKRFQFPTNPPATRRSIVYAFARAAAFIRGLPELSDPLKRKIMREALDQAERRLANRYLALKRRWAEAGCPTPPPWTLLAQRGEERR